LARPPHHTSSRISPQIRHGRDVTAGRPGGCTLTSATPLAPDTLDRLRRISTPTLTTQLFKLGFRNTFLAGVRPLCPDKRMAGEAVTLRFAPARGGRARHQGLGDPRYPQRPAIEHIQPGQVLVMACRGVSSAATAGDILVSRLQVRGAAGLVLDGGIRDYPSVQGFGFPVYALGPAAPAHVARHVAVDENVPIGCAEVLVVPGDVMVGDGEGVVCVPRAVADQVAARGLEQEELEAFILEKVRGGAPLPGTYPPGEQTLAEDEAGKKRRRTSWAGRTVEGTTRCSAEAWPARRGTGRTTPPRRWASPAATATSPAGRRGATRCAGRRAAGSTSPTATGRVSAWTSSRAAGRRP